MESNKCLAIFDNNLVAPVSMNLCVLFSSRALDTVETHDNANQIVSVKYFCCKYESNFSV